MPTSETALAILHEICSLPTAPFMEQAVQDYARAFAKKRGLKVTADSWGNLLLEMKSTSKQPRWIFAAHMDHPAFIANRMIDRNTLEADFRGYVLADHLGHVKVRFLGELEVVGTLLDATPLENLPRTKNARFRVSKPVQPGTMGMFDFGTGRIKGGKFFSRACDDVAGVAAALAMLDEITSSRSNRPVAPVAVLLTRAEEMAFIGAIACCLKPELLRKTDRLVAIECSAEQLYAKQGDGVIVRIGDKTSIFHSGLSYFMTRQAEGMAKADKTFKFQRALMPGGTCESTVYDIYGYLAAAVCVPLGNYHNMDSAKKKMGPEYVNVNDWQNMVKLFVHLARNGHTYEEGHRHLKETVEKRFREVEHLFAK